MDPQPTRTVLITNGNLLSLLSLGEFLRTHHGQLAGVCLTTRLPSQRSNVGGIVSMWRHSGLAYTYSKLLTNVLLPRRLRARGLPATIPDYLQHLGSDVPVIRAPDVNAAPIVARIQAMKPAILLSFSATSRFKDPLIETPSRVAINAHYALLPGYAGLSPYYWYLHNKENECGVTLHAIVPKLDAGPIIEQQRFAMAGLRTVMQVLLKQTACVSPMLERFYRGETSERDATAQDLTQRSYFRHPTRAQVRAFAQQGFRFHTREDLAIIQQRVEELVRR